MNKNTTHHTHVTEHAGFRYGEIVNINYVRDKATGKPKGFCFLCFEDQRSTILTVDNLNGAKVLVDMLVSLEVVLFNEYCSVVDIN